MRDGRQPARRGGRAVLEIAGVADAAVELVFEPPWDLGRMSGSARFPLGMWSAVETASAGQTGPVGAPRPGEPARSDASKVWIDQDLYTGDGLRDPEAPRASPRSPTATRARCEAAEECPGACIFIEE